MVESNSIEELQELIVNVGEKEAKEHRIDIIAEISDKVKN